MWLVGDIFGAMIFNVFLKYDNLVLIGSFLITLFARVCVECFSYTKFRRLMYTGSAHYVQTLVIL